MKKNHLILLIAFFSVGVNANTQFFNQQEKSYKTITSLQNELRELELQEQIQQLELKIKNNQALLNPPPPVARPVPAKTRPSVANKPVPSFMPNQVKVLYLIGAGAGRSAVVSHKGESHTLRDGTTFHGWRVQVKDKNVVFSRGNNNITL